MSVENVPTPTKKYFIPIFEHERGGVEVKRPNGERVWVRPLIENVDADAETLSGEMIGDTFMSRIVIDAAALPGEPADSAIASGIALPFSHLVGWAIEHGYLEAYEEKGEDA